MACPQGAPTNTTTNPHMSTTDTDTPEVADEVVDPATSSPIAEYNATAAALAELRQRLAGKVYDLRTTAGDKEARSDRQELTKLLSALEAKRQELKAPVLDRGRLLDAEAKRIAAELEKLREPIDKAIRADEQRRTEERQAREDAERDRMNKLRTRLDYMRGVAARAAGKPAAEVRAKLDMMKGLAIGEDFAEFIDEARHVHAEVTLQLQDMLAAVEAQEAEAMRLKSEREAMDRQRLADAKIQELHSLTVGMAGKSSATLRAAMEALSAVEITAEVWGEHQQRGESARAAVLIDLGKMFIDAEDRERVAAEQAAEAQRLEAQREELRQLQFIADEEAKLANANSGLIGLAVSWLEQMAAKQPGSQAVQDARWAAIMRLRAHRDLTAAKEADAEAARAAKAAAQVTEEPGAQQVLKAEPATADATDRDAPAMPSPSGGSMGAGQAAAAAPVAEAPSIKLGDLCAEFGEGFKMTEAFVSGVLGTVGTKGERGAVMFTASQRRQAILALRDICNRLAGAA
jgi:hypothetical protein